ncbi:hypothetical protein ACTXT7_011243 [Hymenolepis weldensis]
MPDCLRAVQKAVRLGFLDFDNFDLEDYEYNEKVENGDLSWIVPNKFIAFSGPHARTMMDNGYPMHAPEFYLPYFKKNNVTNVIRLNQKMYDSSKFTRAGISHHDLIFPDGSVPSKLITRQFLEICESAPGVIAVHCKEYLLYECKSQFLVQQIIQQYTGGIAVKLLVCKTVVAGLISTSTHTESGMVNHTGSSFSLERLHDATSRLKINVENCGRLTRTPPFVSMHEANVF